MAATMTTVPASAVAAPAHRLASSAAFASPDVQRLAIVRRSATASKIVAARASSRDEEHRSVKKPQMLVALVAAGAALALCAAPVLPAQAGLFGSGAKVDRGAAAPGFPGNEGSGTEAGDNASARGAASSGTALGDAGSAAAQAAKGAVETGIDVNIDPLKTKIGDINPLNSTLNPAASDAN